MAEDKKYELTPEEDFRKHGDREKEYAWDDYVHEDGEMPYSFWSARYDIDKRIQELEYEKKELVSRDLRDHEYIRIIQNANRITDNPIVFIFSDDVLDKPKEGEYWEHIRVDGQKWHSMLIEHFRPIKIPFEWVGESRLDFSVGGGGFEIVIREEGK